MESEGGSKSTASEMPYKEVLEKKEKNMDAEGEKAKDQIWRYPLQRKADATARVNFDQRASLVNFLRKLSI